MKNTMILMSVIAALTLFTGCGDTITENNAGDTTSVNCGDGGCGDVVVGDNNQLHSGEESQSDVTSSVDFDLANYSKDLSQSECNDLGFFYCTLANECQPTPKDTGTCPNK